MGAKNEPCSYVGQEGTCQRVKMLLIKTTWLNQALDEYRGNTIFYVGEASEGATFDIMKWLCDKDTNE